MANPSTPIQHRPDTSASITQHLRVAPSAGWVANQETVYNLFCIRLQDTSCSWYEAPWLRYSLGITSSRIPSQRLGAGRDRGGGGLGWTSYFCTSRRLQNLTKLLTSPTPHMPTHPQLSSHDLPLANSTPPTPTHTQIVLLSFAAPHLRPQLLLITPATLGLNHRFPMTITSNSVDHPRLTTHSLTAHAPTLFSQVHNVCAAHVMLQQGTNS